MEPRLVPIKTVNTPKKATALGAEMLLPTRERVSVLGGSLSEYMRLCIMYL
jgi:hypothetical protein